MGNYSVIKNSKHTFIEQLKIDGRNEANVLGVFLNPNEFPKSGLIVISDKSISNYSPLNGYLINTFSFYYIYGYSIIYCDYNRKSKDGSIAVIVTEDHKISFINTENLTIVRTLLLNTSKLNIKDNSRITSINFKLADTIFIGYSDGSIIKAKFNEDPLNLLLENSAKFNSSEDEFQNIKSVYSTDYINTNNNITNDNTIENPASYSIPYSNIINSKSSFSVDNEVVEKILISNRYKILFGIHKINAGVNKINMYCLRNNTFSKTFAKIEGMFNNAKLIDNRDLLLVIVFNIENKHTFLEIWSFVDSNVPIAKYDLSKSLDYSFTVKTIHTTLLPTKYIGRSSNHGLMDGDLIFFGTTKGDVIVGKIYSFTNNTQTVKMGYEQLYIYKLKNNSAQKTDEISNNFEISFISYDLFFDVLVIGDVSSNVRFFEKVLQIGKSRDTNAENLPFFSLFYEAEKEAVNTRNTMKYEINQDLPVFSVNHDVLKDRSIIMYDQGKDIVISAYDSEEEK